jgi:putative hydrolase of the HAD superfamily
MLCSTDEEKEQYMSDITTVIFDVGGVLIRTEDWGPRRALERRLGLAAGAAEELVFGDPAGRQAQLGEISSAELWAWIRRELDLDEASWVAFEEGFWGGDRLDAALVDYIRALRPAFRTAILSNWRDDLPQVLTAQYPMADAFDEVIYSAAEGVMKPDAAIFEAALARLGVPAGQAIFIDDFAHNVAGARAVGLHAIHYTPGLDVPAALAEFGVVTQQQAG